MKNLRQDYRAYKMNFWKATVGMLTLSTFWLVVMYRTASWLYSKKIPLVPYMIKAAGVSLFSADISPAARIGPGFRIAHSVGIVIGPGVIAGENLELFQNATLGGRNREKNNVFFPILGDNVTIFTGAVVIGPIRIGDNVCIGANSVVIHDVKANVVVAGAPAKVVREPQSLKGVSRTASKEAII